MSRFFSKINSFTLNLRWIINLKPSWIYSSKSLQNNSRFLKSWWISSRFHEILANSLFQISSSPPRIFFNFYFEILKKTSNEFNCYFSFSFLFFFFFLRDIFVRASTTKVVEESFHLKFKLKVIRINVATLVPYLKRKTEFFWKWKMDGREEYVGPLRLPWDTTFR